MDRESPVRRRRQAKVAVQVAALLWVTVVVASYYIAHKPFDTGNVVALAQALLGLGAAGLVVALGIGFGLPLLEQVDLPLLEQVIWGAALGLGVLSLVGLGLGAVGLLHPWLLWAVTVTGLGIRARRVWHALRDAWFDPTWRPQSTHETLLAGYCGFMLIVGLVWALTPPTAWDGLVYHLTGPKLYLASGSISHRIDLPYLGFPQLTEMLFTWGMGIAGERAAASIHWFYGLLAVAALVTAGRRWLGDSSGWAAAAVLLSARTIVFLLGWPYVDLPLLLYTTLAFLALGHWGENRNGKWLTLSGALAGLALSTKYTALAVLPALGVALLTFERRSRRSPLRAFQSTIRNLALLGGAAVLTWAPWLAKNLLLTGNATYPFFFDGAYWDSWRSWWYDRPGSGLAYTAPWGLVTAPWDATIWGVEGGTGYSATIGPLFLALTPLLALVWSRLEPRRRDWLQVAGCFCITLYGFWLWGVARTALLRQTRLLFPAFGLLALMTGATIEMVRLIHTPAINLAWLTRTIMLVVLALTLVSTLLYGVRERPLQVLLGFESEEGFLARRLGWHYNVMNHISSELSARSAVLFLWEPRSYYCSVDCRPDALLDRWLHMIYLHGHDAHAIAEAWRADGITHLLVYRTGYETVIKAQFDPITEADRVLLEDLLTNETELLEDFDGVYEIYALRETSSP